MTESICHALDETDADDTELLAEAALGVLMRWLYDAILGLADVTDPSPTVALPMRVPNGSERLLLRLHAASRVAEALRMLYTADSRAEVESDQRSIREALGAWHEARRIHVDPDYFDPVEQRRFTVVRRWAYCDDSLFGNGFRSGEFLLRSDGIVFERFGSSRTGRHGTMYTCGAWVEFSRWTSVAKLTAQLKSSGYDLYTCMPVPVDASQAGLFIGTPPNAVLATDLE
jgi:hypothetical protein